MGNNKATGALVSSHATFGEALEAYRKSDLKGLFLYEIDGKHQVRQEARHAWPLMGLYSANAYNKHFPLNSR